MLVVRVLAWNLNHRAARRRIPFWIAEAIVCERPDLVILTEYVEGDDHARFMSDLAAAGLAFQSVSLRINRSNQILLAARRPLASGRIEPATFHESIGPNFMHAALEPSGIQIVGFRMPAYVRAQQGFKRRTWDWLADAISPLRFAPSLVIGDFNTSFGDPVASCGDCLDRMVSSGWQHVRPANSAVSFRTRTGRGRLIDHAFVSAAVRADQVEYSWRFQDRSSEARSGHVGRPDHAMLIVDLTTPC